ncbi:gliding motility-associated C-terminal domain-containing protein [Flavobacteriales bacterium]|nr:gliding motility-associated C-terminal domain-containing protein [Flavobacteriales bacterium]MDA9262196.1 gliding motility-associated C-terminal domain-containing protein [bacterium]MDB4089090.1 gliding motility-associated C-terminal domain-containing protein [Flavobacteriales bacterium]
MSKRILIFFVFSIIFSFNVVSQSTFPMKDTVVAECDGIHTDSDAKIFPAGQYNANEDFTFSICPGTGATVYYTFTSFYTESLLDTLTFFNGPNILSPRLGQYSGNLNATLPGTIIANSGCLTIHFKSDGVLEFPGWIANWNTYAPVVIPPTLNVSSIEPPECDSTSFLIEFDKNVHCDSIVSSIITFTGYNPPTVLNITKVGCTINDSSRFARVWLNSPFVYNCEYIMNMNINIPDICDSVYNFDVKDTFDFVNCDLLAQITTTNDSLCFGDCADLEVTTSATCNTYSYAWSNSIPSSAGPHNVCPIATTTYYVTVTESTTGKQYMDSITIKVLDTLDKDLDIFTNTSEPPECNDRFFKVRFDRSLPCYLIDSGIFTLTSSAGAFTVTNVYPLNCTNGMLDSVRLRLNNRFSKNCEYYLDYNLNFTDSCEGPITIFAQDTFLITDCPFTLSTTYSDTICVNNCTNLDAVVSGCDGYTYLWSNGLPNSSGPFIVCPTGDTTFYLQVTEISTGLILLDTITIKVIDPTINAITPMCAYDSPINLTAQTMGGVWSGNGITNPTGIFDPSVAGSGLHLITYTFNSCTDTVLIDVTDPNAGSNLDLCASGISVNLFPATPSGGVWSGINVNSITSEFTPTTYGNFTAFYTVNGCVDSINIFVDTISFLYNTDTVCGNSQPIYIPFTPLGGNWSGTGIISASSGIFDPAVAINGSNLVNYFYKGCRDTVNMVVVTVDAGPDTNACPSQSPFNITSGFPLSGSWSGIGITDTSAGTFNPGTTVGNWMSNLVYTFKGCSDSLVMDVVQTNIIPDTLYFCPGQDSVLISTIPGLSTNPNYGIWSGIGVTTYGNSSYLYPNFLGNGFHTIFYDKNTCQDSLIIAIYPDSLSYSDTTICSTITPFKLDSINNFSGATWLGTGIINSSTGLFDPSLASAGVNVITYRTKGGICDKTINVTVNLFAAASITLLDTHCFINQNIPIPVSPSGGTWSGTGNYNQTTGVFNPAIAGPGTHQIIYSFGSGACFTTDEISVFVRDSIVATLSTNADTICLGNNTTLTATAYGGYPIPNYLYSWSHSAITTNTDIVSPTTTTQYIVTIDDGCSKSSSDTTTITVLSINPNVFTSTPVCFGEIGYATYDLTQKSIYNFTWTKPSVIGDTVFGVGNDSAYLRVSNNFGCFIDTFLVIPGYGFIDADFDLNPDLYPRCLSSQDKTLTVNDKSTGATTGVWDFGNGNTLPYLPTNASETNNYADGGNYTVSLIVKNDGPCYDTLTKQICVSDQIYFIPDIFSPNGDGVNDILFVRSSEVEELNFRVFDRWGKMVFESSSVDQGWDGTFKGKNLEAGVYFYYVYMKLVSGEELNEKGDVTIKR